MFRGLIRHVASEPHGAVQPPAVVPCRPGSTLDCWGCGGRPDTAADVDFHADIGVARAGTLAQAGGRHGGRRAVPRPAGGRDRDTHQHLGLGRLGRWAARGPGRWPGADAGRTTCRGMALQEIANDECVQLGQGPCDLLVGVWTRGGEARLTEGAAVARANIGSDHELMHRAPGPGIGNREREQSALGDSSRGLPRRDSSLRGEGGSETPPSGSR